MYFTTCIFHACTLPFTFGLLFGTFPWLSVLNWIHRQIAQNTDRVWEIGCFGPLRMVQSSWCFAYTFLRPCLLWRLYRWFCGEIYQWWQCLVESGASLKWGKYVFFDIFQPSEVFFLRWFWPLQWCKIELNVHQICPKCPTEVVFSLFSVYSVIVKLFQSVQNCSIIVM